MSETEVNPRAVAEPGNPALSRVVGWLVLLFILGVAVVQQTGVTHPAAPPDPGAIATPSAQLELSSKFAVKLFHLGAGNPRLEAFVAQRARDQVDALRQEAASPEDRVRVALVAAELLGPDEGIAALEEEREGLADGTPLADDADRMLGALRSGRIPDDQAAGLGARHGWFARLLRVIGKDDSDPERQAVVGGGMRLAAVLGGFFGLAACAIIAGFVLLVVALVKLSGGSLRAAFRPLAVGGSALIETVGVFIVAFLAVGMLAGVLLPEGSLAPRLAAQWAIALVVLWPIARGMRAGAALHALGLHRGRGVAREVGAGIVGFLACMPLLLLGLLSMLVLSWLVRRMGVGGGPIQSPIVEVVSGGASHPWAVVLVFALATVWAPLVEEVVFRGALFGHLRKRWGVVVSGLTVAAAFGLMHGYPLHLLGGVMSLGFGFSLLREWRGSLIAPMVAHFIQNGSLLTFFLLLTWAAS